MFAHHQVAGIFTTYHGQLKMATQNYPISLFCKNWPKTVQPAQPNGQSCQKWTSKKDEICFCVQLLYISIDLANHSDQ
jgi:hypothetical protein